MALNEPPCPALLFPAPPLVANRPTPSYHITFPNQFLALDRAGSGPLICESNSFCLFIIRSRGPLTDQLLWWWYWWNEAMVMTINNAGDVENNGGNDDEEEREEYNSGDMKHGK